MANIFDYLIWRGDLPLSVSPFNEVDGAVFARLSYLPFELIMPCDPLFPSPLRMPQRRLFR